MSRLALVPLVVLCPAGLTQVHDKEDLKLEFIGLETWTPAKVDAAITERCEAHYCAANLEGVLGFADAAVLTTFTDEGEPTKLILVVEDPSHVRRKAFEGTGSVPPEWEAFAGELGDEISMPFDLALRHYPILLTEGEDAAHAEIAKLEWAVEFVPLIQGTWEFLRAHAEPEDLATALWHLDHNPSYEARRIAAAILLSFHEQDVAWWALADGMRDPDDRVSGPCWQGLRRLGENCARDVDWRPAVPTLRALLAGTHCFGLIDVCQMLARTRIEGELAGEILADGGPLVLSLAAARADFARERSRALLARLSGKPDDAPIEDLRAWFETLPDGREPDGDRKR